MVDSGDSVVVTSGLTKVFRDFWLREKVTAVAELDLEIRPKEVFGLLGPNGSGKSTTIKMILGLLFPTRGRIAVLGHRPTDVATKARIGFLPEESYLYPFLDARETLDFYGQLFHQPRAQRRIRVDMLLEMVGLASVAHRRIGEYSKGMQRRIGLAQALINDPDLLIVDEPTSGMDPVGTRQFKDLIRTLAHRGKTVILSSHLLGDVEDICDRVCILYGGRRQALGGVEELLCQSSLTQVTTDRLDAPTLDKVADVLAASGRTIREVSAPREKLEDLFLRIVQEAKDRKQATGGAVAGGAVAEFLRGPAAAGEPDAGRAVVEGLVAAASVEKQAPAPQPAAAPAKPPPPAPVGQVIEGLLGAGAGRETEGKDKGKDKGEAAPPGAGPAAAPAAKAPDADRAVIDELLGKDARRGKGP
jgi:ABC-2 type transport system ATP-binding protein